MEETHSPVKVAIISRAADSLQAYGSEADRLGINAARFSSFRELHDLMTEVPFNGVLIDVPTRMMAPKNERPLINEILEMYPVIHMGWERDTETIQTLNHGSIKGLEEFIEQKCRGFAARTLRSQMRKKAHLNILLNSRQDLRFEQVEKTVTMDISTGGCFIFSGENWENCSSAYLIAKELNDRTPIEGEVRWHLGWGNQMRIPGIGILFTKITESQRKEIADFM